MSARRRRSAHPPMTAVAMQLDTLDAWLQGRANHGAAATNLSMLDGFVTAIVAGPVSMDPPEWICPLLGVEIDAFNHGGTPEFAAISAVAVRHNAIVETLSTAPNTFEPIFARKPNHDIDAGPWCEGFYAAMSLRLSAWAPSRLSPTPITACCSQSCFIVSTIRAARCSTLPRRARKPNCSDQQPTRTFRPPLKLCANTGCRCALRPDRSRRATWKLTPLTIYPGSPCTAIVRNAMSRINPISVISRPSASAFATIASSAPA